MSEETNSNPNTNIGALWARESRTSNQKYLAGHVKVQDDFGEEKVVKVVVFKNNRKEKENQPDYQIYKARGAQQPSTSASAETASNDSTEAAAVATSEEGGETLL